MTRRLAPEQRFWPRGSASRYLPPMPEPATQPCPSVPDQRCGQAAATPTADGVSALAPGAAVPSGSPSWGLGCRIWLLWLVAPLLAIGAGAAGLDGAFVLDDQLAIVRHPVVIGAAPLSQLACFNHHGVKLPRCERGGTSRPAPGWRPLSTLFFALQWRVFGASAFAFRLIGVLAYGLLALSVVVFGLRLGLSLALAAGWAACFAALAIHVEAVVAPANTPEVWALLLTLIALIALLGRHPSWALVACALALGFKESAALLPALASALALWHRPARRPLVLFGLWAIVLGFLLVRAEIVPIDVGGWTHAADNALIGAPLVSRWLGGLALLGRYCVQLLAPVSLAVDYSYAALAPASAVYSPAFWGAALGLCASCALGAFAWHQRLHRPWALVGWLLTVFWGTVALPLHWLVPLPIVYAERLFFMPSLWLLGVAALIAGQVSRRWPLLRRPLLVLAGSVVVIQLSFFVLRAREWSAPLRLFAAQVREQPASVKGQIYYAQELAAHGRNVAALWHLALASAGRQAFPRQWRPPQRPRARKEVLVAIATLIAPGLAPAAAWRRTAVLARRFLGSPAARLAATMALEAEGRPRSQPSPTPLKR